MSAAKFLAEPLPLCVVLLSLALGATSIGADANAATASDGGAPPATAAQWCVIQHDGSSAQPKCYENLISCAVAAIADASSCSQQSPSETAVGHGASSAVPLPRRRPRVLSRDDTLTGATGAQHDDTLTAEQRDQLFRDFVRWKGVPMSKTN